MKRNLSLALITSLFIGLNLFFSCSKVEDGDHTAPTIEVLSPEAYDTLYVYRENDTIFPIFTASFSDETGLSSYTFKIKHGKDTLHAENGDTTAYFMKNYQSVSIFDTTQIKISQTFLIDSLMSVTKNRRTKSYPIWEGVYYLHASVVDMQGNIAESDSIPIFIKYRSSQNVK